MLTDNEKPVIDVCPSDQSVTTDSGVATAVVTWTPPTATDNFGVPTLTSTPNSGDTFQLETTRVTYTATDDAGNTETCTFFVIVGKLQCVLFRHEGFCHGAVMHYWRPFCLPTQM